MTDDTRTEVRRRLADTSESGLSADQITDDLDLRDDLGLDSLDAIMLMLDLEERYDVDVEDDELKSLDTVASLIALVDSKRRNGDSPSR